MMARASFGLAYPEKIYAASSYAGLDGSPNSNNKDISSRFPNDAALILYALYEQVAVGPCNVSKPSSWSPLEQGKWKSWQQLGDGVSTEAMRLFVKISEEEEPGWYSRANSVFEHVIDVQKNHFSNVEPIIENGNSFAETKTISADNGSLMETQDKDVVSEGLGSVVVYDQWNSPPITSRRPTKARYEHGAAVVQDTKCIYVVEITMVIT